MNKKQTKPKKPAVGRGDEYVVYGMVRLVADGTNHEVLTNTISPTGQRTWELFNRLDAGERYPRVCHLKKFTMVQQ